MTRPKNYATLLLMLASALTGAAQEIAPRHELAFTLGGRPALNRGGLELGSGAALQANYGYRISGGETAALYGEVHFLATPQQRIAGAVPDTATRDVATIFLTPGLRLKFLPMRAVSPYVAAGAGWALFEQSKLTLGGQPNVAPRELNHGTFAYGGGVDVRLWRWLALRAEVRDFYAGRPAYNVATIRGGGQHNVVLGGGFVLRFR